MSPIILEFNGLPGCGKTTTADSIIEYYETKGIQTKKLKPLGKDSINNVLHFRVPFIKILKSINIIYHYLIIAFWANPFRKETWKRFLFVAGISMVYQTSDYDNPVIAVIDQGVVQGMYSLYAFHEILNPNIIAKHYKKILEQAPISLVLNCNLPEEESLNRIRKRYTPFYHKFDSLEKDEQLHRALCDYGSRMQFFRKDIKKDSIDIDMMENLDDNMNCIVTYTNRLLSIN